MNLILNFKNFLKKILFICGEKFKNKIYKLFFFAFFLSLLEFIGLGLFVSFVVSIFGNQNYFFNFLLDINLVSNQEMMLIIFFVYTIKLILSMFFQYKIYTYLFELHYDLSRTLIKIYLNKPYSFFTKINSSILVRNVYSEIGIFTYQIIIAFSILISDLILIFALICLLMMSDIISTIFISILLISTYLIYYFASKPFVKSWGKTLVKQKFLIHNALKETFSSIKEIKIFNIEKFFLNKFSINLLKYSQSSRNQSISSQFPKFFFEYIIILIFLLLSSFFYFRGISTDQIFINLTLFAAASLRLMPCFSRISTQTQSITFYKPTVDILYQEFEQKNKKEDLLEKKETLYELEEFKFKNSIDIKNVDFSFSDKTIFKKINFSIKKNQIVGIFGKSGEGKTTLVDIICGIINPNKGEVLIDNKYDIHKGQYKTRWLKKIGYVTQDIYLLNDTIKNNILYGKDNFDNEKFTKVLKNSQFDELINDFKEKEDTVVGENGVNFSGGQKKRLAIARALYRNPELIIFDETTSSLDIENEKKIFRMLNELKNGRCVIIISHNKKTLKYCDKVIEVKDCYINEILN